MKAIFLTLSMLVITIMNTQAQGFHLGIKGGANMDKINGQSFDDEFKFGYNVGAFAELNLAPTLGIQPELLFNQSTYRTGSDFSDVYPEGVNDVEGKLNYLTVPVLLSFRPVPVLSIQAGPQFGIAVNQDQKLTENTKDAFKSGDFALVGGVQLNLSSLRIGGRWVEGLSNVNDYTSTTSWKHKGFQIYAGFTIL